MSGRVSVGVNVAEHDESNIDIDLYEQEEEVECWEFEGQHPALIHVEKFLNESAHTRWLVEGMLAHNSLAMVFGPPGAGKSFFSIDLSLQVASSNAGDKFHGKSINACECVLYVTAEGRDGVRDRVDGWMDYNKVEAKESRFFIWDTEGAPLDLLDADCVGEFIKVVDCRYPWSLVVIDTLARCFGSGDENSTRDMSTAVASLEKIRAATRACVLVVHHTGKGDANSARGSNAIKAAINTEIKVRPSDSGFQVSCTKQKDAEPFTSFRLDIRPHSFVTEAHGLRREISTAIATRHAGEPEKNSPRGRVTENRRAVLQVITALSEESPGKRILLSVADFNGRLSNVKPGIAKGSASAALKWAVEENILLRPNDAQIEIGPSFEPLK